MAAAHVPSRCTPPAWRSSAGTACGRPCCRRCAGTFRRAWRAPGRGWAHTQSDCSSCRCLRSMGLLLRRRSTCRSGRTQTAMRCSRGRRCQARRGQGPQTHGSDRHTCCAASAARESVRRDLSVATCTPLASSWNPSTDQYAWSNVNHRALRQINAGRQCRSTRIDNGRRCSRP